jgi:GMP synthase (glutamine-hydrolysing)
MRFLIIRHQDYEGLGTIETWMENNGHTYFYTNSYAGVKEPPNSHLMYDSLILLGGPQRVPYLEKEPILKRSFSVAEAFLKQGKKVFGVCLGAQIIAKIFGLEIQSGDLSLGFSEVKVTDQDLKTKLNLDTIPCFQWHQDHFALPENTTKLFENNVSTQGFINAQVLGLQFHLELNFELYEAWFQVAHMRSPGVSGQLSAPSIQQPFAIMQKSQEIILDSFY